MSTKDLMALVREKKGALEAQSGRREKTHKPQVGRSRWRILPGWRKDGDPTFYHDFGQHFVKDLKNDLKAVYICTDKTFGKPCEICSALADAVREATNDDVIKALDEAKSKMRILVNALHLDGEDPTTPVILDLTPTTFEKVLDIIGEYGPDFLDLQKGTDIVINRTGRGINTEYSVMAAAKSNPVDPSVMSKLHDLDEYVKQEYEQGQQKALAALSHVSGRSLTAGAFAGPGLLTGPTGKTGKIEDDEIPISGAAAPKTIEGSATVVKEEPIAGSASAAAEPAPSTSEGAPAPADDFSGKFTDADIERLLGDM